MAEKEYMVPLGPLDRLRHRIKTDRGEVVDFVVQHETVVEGEYKPVVRYDGSHGHGHRHLLDPNGETYQKDWLPEHMDLKESLNYAANDLRENWERYLDQFLERYG